MICHSQDGSTSGSILSKVESTVKDMRSVKQKLESLKQELNSKLSAMDPNDPLFQERKRIIHNSLSLFVVITRANYKFLRLIQGFYSCQFKGLNWFIDHAKKEPR